MYWVFSFQPTGLYPYNYLFLKINPSGKSPGQINYNTKDQAGDVGSIPAQRFALYGYVANIMGCKANGSLHQYQAPLYSIHTGYVNWKKKPTGPMISHFIISTQNRQMFSSVCYSRHPAGFGNARLVLICWPNVFVKIDTFRHPHNPV